MAFLFYKDLEYKSQLWDRFAVKTLFFWNVTVAWQIIGNLRSYDGNCNENATLKLNFALS